MDDHAAGLPARRQDSEHPTTSPSSETRPPRHSALPNTDLLDHLVCGSLGPLSRLQETVERTIEQVSQWIDEPFNRHQITNLVTLLDAQTQLIICQQRLVAVSRMVDVAMNAPGHETVRRACADLLKIRLVDPYKDDKRPVRMPMAPPIDTDAVLDALEKLGRESFEESAPVPIEKSPAIDTSALNANARAARAVMKRKVEPSNQPTRATPMKAAIANEARAKLSTRSPEMNVHKKDPATAKNRDSSPSRPHP